MFYKKFGKVRLTHLVVAFDAVTDNWRPQQNNLKLFSPFWCLNISALRRLMTPALFVGISALKNSHNVENRHCLISYRMVSQEGIPNAAQHTQRGLLLSYALLQFPKY